MPEVITFDDTKTITTEYDAEGTKLKKIVSGGETTDYEEDDIYVNGNLYQTSHDEGRIANGVYEYNITDHNNDLRIAFKDSAGIAVPTQSIFYDSWGLSMKGMQIIRSPLNFNKFQFLNRETQFETGYVDLIHRQFDPQTGRFTSQDGVIEGQEHLSLYQYGWNNPTLKPDPDGLMPCCGEVNDYDESMKSALPEMSHKSMMKGMEQMVGTMLGFTDANDAAVLVTSITRGGDGINFDGSKASGADKGFALLGAVIPAVSGSAVKKIGGAIIDAVNGNSKLSSKAQHLYEIFEKATSNVVKTGISGGQVSKTDKSYRATNQVNKLNKAEGVVKYDSKIVEKIPGGKGAREKALKAEITNADKLRASGQLTDRTKHVKP